MPKVIMILWGKYVAEKLHTYANKIKQTNYVVILSVDEIMLALFSQNVSSKYISRIKSYLYKKSLGILYAGLTLFLFGDFELKANANLPKSFTY